MDERAEKVWKWALRGLGVIGFVVLLLSGKDAPVAFYVLLGGLLGLPNVITYQMTLNRENQRLKEAADAAASGLAPGRGKDNADG